MSHNPDLDTRQLISFLAVAKLGSISKGAEQLSVTQPALSRQISLMEDRLGVKLFERHGKGVTVTGPGRLLEERAESIIEQLKNAEIDVSAAAGQIIGHVTIGLPPTIEHAIAGSVAAEYLSRFPQVTLGIMAGYSGFVREWLESGRVDLGVLYNPQSKENLRLSPLLEETLYLIGPPTDRLGERGEVSFKDMADLPFVLPTPDHGLRKQIEEVARANGVQLQVAVEVEALHTQIDLVMRGVGYTVLPLVTVYQEVSDERLTAARIKDPEIIRELVIATPSARPQSQASKELINCLRNRITQMVNAGVWPGTLEPGREVIKED